MYDVIFDIRSRKERSIDTHRYIEKGEPHDKFPTYKVLSYLWMRSMITKYYVRWNLIYLNNCNPRKALLKILLSFN